MSIAAQREPKITEPRTRWLVRSLTVPPGNDRWMLLSAMVLCACVFGWIAWQRLWSFWLDEAMLLVAIEHVHAFAGLFRPLPLYDQGLPTGFALVAWALHEAALPMLTQKLLPILSSAAILPALVATARRSGFGATATMFCIFMLVASPGFSYLFGNFKQYAFEMLAVTLMLLAAVSEQRTCAVLLIASCIVSLCFTFVTPIILVMLLFLYKKVSTPLLLGVVAIVASSFAAAYVIYLKVALQLALSNAQYGFKPGFLSLSPRTLNVLAHVFMSHMPELPVCTYDFRRLFTLLSLFGAAVALVRRERIGLMFVAVILVLTVLSALHLYLLGEGRYSAYLLPFLVLLGGRSVQAVVTALRPLRARFPVRVTLEARLAKQVALLLLVGFSLACFVRNSAWFLRVGALPYAALAAADAARPDAIVPLGLGQPQVDLVRSHSHLSTRRFVEVNPTEAARLSDEEIQRHPPDLFEEPGAWPLVMRAEQVRLGWLDTTTPLRIDDYFGWIQQQAELLHRVVFIAPTCMALPDSHLGRLMQGLAQTGTIRELDTTPCYSTVLWTQADTMPGASTPGSRP